MEEDDSILDTPHEDIIVRETQTASTDSPRSFSKQLISRFSLSQTAGAEIALSQTINNSITLQRYPVRVLCFISPGTQVFDEAKECNGICCGSLWWDFHWFITLVHSLLPKHV